jgi:hypothetical protein
MRLPEIANASLAWLIDQTGQEPGHEVAGEISAALRQAPAPSGSSFAKAVAFYM